MSNAHVQTNLVFVMVSRVEIPWQFHTYENETPNEKIKTKKKLKKVLNSIQELNSYSLRHWPKNNNETQSRSQTQQKSIEHELHFMLY